MKTTRASLLAAAALVAGFLIARWGAAQPPNQPVSKEQQNYDCGALQKFESLVIYLQDTKQTNILKRFNDCCNASIASRNCADLGMTAAILQRLRAGRTNEAYEMLEGRLDSDVISFAASYRELPKPLQEQGSLKVLGYVKDYRAKFPFKVGDRNVDDGVADAFKILDGNAAK